MSSPCGRTRAAAAQDAGAFKDQIVGIKTKDADGNDTVVLDPPRRHRRVDGEDQARVQGRRRDPRR
jgi:acetyl-CoA acyltransferase